MRNNMRSACSLVLLLVFFSLLGPISVNAQTSKTMKELLTDLKEKSLEARTLSEGLVEKLQIYEAEIERLKQLLNEQEIGFQNLSEAHRTLEESWITQSSLLSSLRLQLNTLQEEHDRLERRGNIVERIVLPVVGVGGGTLGIFLGRALP